MKLATKEVRRLDALVGRLEEQESFFRMAGRSREAAAVRAEIEHLEARMASLVDDADHESA